MAMLIDQIDSSGLFAQSAYSASIATHDSVGNVITATYLTAHQDISNKLDTTAFSTVSGNFLTAHQDLSNYVTETDLESTSATITAMIPSTAGLATESDLQIVSGGLDYVSGSLTGYLTTGQYETDSAVFNAKQDALTFGYDTNNAISSINSSAITTTPSQKLYLQSPLTTGVSAGSAYIGIEPSSTYNETVLWSGTKTSAIQTSESMKNFEKCQVYIAHGTYGPPQVYTIDFADMETTGYFAITRPRGSVNLNIACIKLTADDTHLAIVNSKCLAFGSWSTTATGITATTGEAEDLNSIIKVVGINRKENS